MPRLAVMLASVILAAVAVDCSDQDRASITPIPQDVIMVTPDGLGDYPTIQEAVDAADSKSVVELAPGVYRGEGNRDVDLRGKRLVVRAADAEPSRTIIDCEGSEKDPHRGFSFTSGEGPDCILQGLTIINGYVPPSEHPTLENMGGGALCYQSSPILRNCRCQGCAAGYGGAVYCWECAPEFIGCSFEGNHGAFFGGGIHLATASATLTACAFDSNSASYGGGVAITHRSAYVVECTFTGNQAGEGGGLCIMHGT